MSLPGQLLPARIPSAHLDGTAPWISPGRKPTRARPGESRTPDYLDVCRSVPMFARFVVFSMTALSILVATIGTTDSAGWS
jgi:hypothetical protein